MRLNDWTTRVRRNHGLFDNENQESIAQTHEQNFSPTSHHMLRLSCCSTSSFTTSERLDTLSASDAAMPPGPPTIWL